MKTIAALAFILLALRCTSDALALPNFNIVRLGLDDLEHTRNDGYRYSEAGPLNQTGQVVGYSDRYNGGSRKLGCSAWLYDGATYIEVGLTGVEHTHIEGNKDARAYALNEAGQVTGVSVRYDGGSAILGNSAWFYNGVKTIDIGLTGLEHTRSDGYKYSVPFQLNDAGKIRGYSWRYSGSTSLGQSAWLYNGVTTIDIGLTGAEHTNIDGYKDSEAIQLNEAGQVIGHSDRYNGGSTHLGQSAWLYDGQTTVAIGLTGPEHTRSDGHKHSQVQQLNEAGQASGDSQRFNGRGSAGSSAWLYNGVTTIEIGLTDSEHTESDGDRSSTPVRLNEAGQVCGSSSRLGSVSLGRSAWLYNGVTTIKIGLIGFEHTSSDGEKFSDAGRLNQAGQVTGFSARYNGGSTSLGRSAWLYNGQTTIDVGLTGSEHTRNDGFKYSGGQQLNEAGQVIGTSQRFNGGSAVLGYSAWLYSGQTTIGVGLTGSEHTRNDGFKYSDPEQLNEAGQVIGHSYRYIGGVTQLGQDAWFYDSTLDQSFTLRLSTRSDGYAYSSADYLGEDGLVLGTYTLFDALDSDRGNRVFYFTIADGLHDLGSLINGTLAANGWDYLANTIRANGIGQILGYGKLTSQPGSQMPYLLSPLIPEPSSFVLAIIGVFFLAESGRRPLRRSLIRCYTARGTYEGTDVLATSHAAGVARGPRARFRVQPEAIRAASLAVTTPSSFWS